ncbi:hypothetical protein PsorP6_010258 [Peronosclerospora sorghi]|uniref:Uncharacterized protein n=1 Tax=Peronosclerospora sorghi TaxID=230839 RepID=A0ACC0VV18_9STRA|nr:hypothetical protein PsorP6_010258 [Peronosclerospora sorghi]
MANARLKQARRRAVARHANGPPSTATSTAHPPPRAPAAPNEPVSDAQRERAAIEAALAERKRALEAKLQALTLGKPLSKEVLPGCDGTGRRVTRCHRDYLLQEMEWMAADFQQERKWRARSAKALSQALVSHLDRQEARAARQARSALVAQRRVAARVGREVKKFWSKIDKIIAFKVKLEADDVRAPRAHELVRTCVYPMARRLLAPYDDAFKRTQLFFPDKALVQFDCGKFQQLAVLLRTLKRGHHRCLIFTQMSSMLNLLEVFLNLHGHTYFRLDGATQVDKRQRLMERFNRDDKIFCFILSTRSGGLGINLTGADTVIFYDSDWNPAMDAQAQDRAHRIGQTRDVHIYRLVSEHTVEENILRKAQQKRQLDSLVLAEGQFTTEFFSKASLRELMQREMVEEQENDDDEEVSVETVEKAMAQLEDEEDVVAMKDARAEYLREQHEFDEDGGTVASSPREAGDVGSRPSTPSSMSVSTVASERDDDDDESEEDAPTRRKRARSNEPEPTKKRVKLQVPARDKVREEARDAAEEQKLQAWKASVQSLQHFEDSLNPVDRYALHFREDIDPLYAYTPASNSSVATDPTASTLLDEIAKIEAEKRLDEARLIDDGELIHGQLDARDYSALYRRERARVLFEQRKRQVSGEAWTIRKCAKTQQPFYFNVDTREATWECPAVRRANDEIQRARRRGYAGFPSLALVRVLALIRPYPDRYQAQLVCRNWYQAAQHPSLFVKLSASDAAFATTLTHVARGETVVFGPGVYPLDKIVEISTNVRLLAAPDAHVELQMRSSVTIVGGHALLKRNRIQRNARFGVRLFYHAGHVMIEDNVLAAHPCGHVDVENSGRRFVVRWNVVDKGPPESTPRPHAHGTVRVQTYRVVEKSVPLPLPVPVCQTMTNATTEYWKRHFASLMRPMLFPAGASSALPVAPFTMAMTTSVSGKPTIPSITFPRTGGPSPAGTSGGPTFHRTASAPDVANGAPPSDKGLETMARQEMVLRDTCEKPVEKVVKPRRPKDGATPGVVPSSSSLEGQEKGAMGGTALPATTASDKMMETSASVATAETSASVETAETSASVETAEKKEEDAGEAKG